MDPTEAIVITALSVRLIALLAYTGENFAFLLLVHRQQELLAPTERVRFMGRIGSTFIKITWVLLIAMTISGIAYAQYRGGENSLTFAFTHPASAFGVVLILEGLAELAMFISNGVAHATVLPSLRSAALVSMASPIDGRFKWVTLKGGTRAMRTEQRLGYLVTINVLLGLLSILLGATVRVI